MKASRTRSDEIGHDEDERDNDRDKEAHPDGDTRYGDERRGLDFARLELLAQPVGLLTRVCGETLRLLAQLAVQVEVGVTGVRKVLDGLVAPLTLISHLAPFLLVGHASSLADELAMNIGVGGAFSERESAARGRPARPPNTPARPALASRAAPQDGAHPEQQPASHQNPAAPSNLA